MSDTVEDVLKEFAYVPTELAYEVVRVRTALAVANAVVSAAATYRERVSLYHAVMNGREGATLGSVGDAEGALWYALDRYRAITTPTEPQR